MTSETISGIAARAATLLAIGKIDAATATWIGTSTQRALSDLREGKAVEGKSVAELAEAERMLTQAERG